jgi:flagella basal body P-ring formation protein FlgA
MRQLISKILHDKWTLPAALFALAAILHPGSPAEAMDAAPLNAAAESEADVAAVAPLNERIALAIGKQYPGTRVSLDSKIHWTHGNSSNADGRVSLLGETSRGEMMFAVSDADGHRAGDGWVAFSAWQPARIAAKRVLPGERLSAEQFVRREVNVASGQAREQRGLILDPETDIAALEARQSVLEGQMLLSSSVQRVPDVRRGDAVTVHLISNGLSLSTQGRAEEPAYRGGQIRVTASKTKRELVGKLSPSGIVEVKL